MRLIHLRVSAYVLSICLASGLVGFAVPAQDAAGKPQDNSNVAPHVLPKQTIIRLSLSDTRPHYTTLRELVANPLKFDGQLVQFRAWPAIGWEGDNYLFEQAYQPGMLASGVPAVWFYESGPESGKLWESINSVEVSGGYFRGYFHYVQYTTKFNGMFDPGHLQFDVTEASKLK